MQDQQQQAAWPAAEQTRLLLNAGPVSISISMIIAILLVLLHWAWLPHEILLLWLMLGLVVSGLRVATMVAYRVARHLQSDQFWYRLMMLGVLLSGITWGVAGGAVFQPDSVSHAAFMAFALAGLCAGATAVYSMVPAAFLAFALPTMVPFIMRLAANPDTEFRAMAAMTAIFVLALCLISQRSYYALMDMLKLRTENEVLHHRASHDSLVNLLNHGAFRRRLDGVVAAARHDGAGVGLIFVDLDAFKRVNDTAGHTVGDELLRLIGSRLREACEEPGVAARLGGDEFALVLHPVQPGEVRTLGEDIRAAVAGCEVDRDGTVHRVGASVGAAFGCGHQLTAAELLETADRACYLAKNSGRDRVEMSVIDPESTRERYPRRSHAG